MGPQLQTPTHVSKSQHRGKVPTVDLKKPLKYGQISLKLDLDYLMPKYHRASIETWVWFFAQQNSQDKSQASPSKNVAM